MLIGLVSRCRSYTIHVYLRKCPPSRTYVPLERSGKEGRLACRCRKYWETGILATRMTRASLGQDLLSCTFQPRLFRTCGERCRRCYRFRSVPTRDCAEQHTGQCSVVLSNRPEILRICLRGRLG